jgi:signal transduction histidine kinase/CheY-like chemotaxis protein
MPVAIGLVGIAISFAALWLAFAADDRRIRSVLELRSEWRARDLEAKIRLAGNAVENVAIAAATAPALDVASFRRLAVRARQGLDHVNALQWAPRVSREQIAEFERMAQAQGLHDYRVFDVTPDFRRTDLADREEYFPILVETRLEDDRRTLGLALGRYAGRRIPMEAARDGGGPVATLPVRPIGAPTPDLVYLMFWPVYDGIEVPEGVAERRERLRGFAVGNFNLVSLLEAAIRDTPEIVETIRFSIATGYDDSAANAVAAYSPAVRRVVLEAVAPGPSPAAVLVEREFTVFGQRWRLAFDFDGETVAGMRSPGSWGWLLAGLVLTASLVFYLLRERGRTDAIRALVTERTAELEQTAAQLHQSQKMEAIGNLTGGMAHDFNNLLSVVIGSVDLLQDKVKHDPAALALTDAALQAGLRGAELTRQLLAFARRQRLEPKVTDVNELVTGMTRLLERILEENVEISLVTAPDLWPVTIDPAQLAAALTNLATNARDAMPSGGRLTIETRNTHLDADYTASNPDVVAGDYVLLEVSDTGTGMPAEVLDKVFEPFFTTKEVGRGTGLGLSMAYGFVKQSRGHIKIYSEVGQGTTVRLYLPRAEQPEVSGPRAVAEAPSAPVGGHEAVLVVEDDEDVRRVVVRQLADLAYSVFEAESPEAALAILRNPAIRIDLLFTDIVMPGGSNGRQLAETALTERPELKLLYTSGYTETAMRRDRRLGQREYFISKPYRRSELARKLREVFDR